MVALNDGRGFLMAAQSTSRAVVIGVHELEELRKRVTEAAHADMFPLLDAIGQQQEDSARRRITQTKRSPEGKAWQPWSRDYAKTRGPQHSLLRSEGHLADSLTHQVIGGEAVDIGSNLVYAGIHLYGSEDFVGPVRGGRMPARPYLDTEPGFADSRDRQEICDILRDFAEGLLK